MIVLLLFSLGLRSSWEGLLKTKDKYRLNNFALMVFKNILNEAFIRYSNKRMAIKMNGNLNEILSSSKWLFVDKQYNILTVQLFKHILWLSL